MKAARSGFAWLTCAALIFGLLIAGQHFSSATTSNRRYPTGAASALPTQSGNSGKVLTTDGTNASWATPGSGFGAGNGNLAGVASKYSITFSPVDIAARIAAGSSDSGLYGTVGNPGSSGQTSASQFWLTQDMGICGLRFFGVGLTGSSVIWTGRLYDAAGGGAVLASCSSTVTITAHTPATTAIETCSFASRYAAVADHRYYASVSTSGSSGYVLFGRSGNTWPPSTGCSATLTPIPGGPSIMWVCWNNWAAALTVPTNASGSESYPVEPILCP